MNYLQWVVHSHSKAAALVVPVMILSVEGLVVFVAELIAAAVVRLHTPRWLHGRVRDYFAFALAVYRVNQLQKDCLSCRADACRNPHACLHRPDPFPVNIS